MQSKAATVAEYLKELPADRRQMVEAVRSVILKNLGQGFAEGMQYGMICYAVPHSLYPPGYHCDPKQPLPYIALASQKNYLSLYMMPQYVTGDGDSFAKAWAKTGKKLDMAKSCIRFQQVEDLALDVIADAIRPVDAKKWIEIYESKIKDARKSPARRPAKATAKKPPKKSPAKSRLKPARKR